MTWRFLKLIHHTGAIHFMNKLFFHQTAEQAAEQTIYCFINSF